MNGAGAQASSDSALRHVCHCGKSFIRKEHLTRHQASHDRPAFICRECQRQFSRKDLFRRHVLVHEKQSPRIAVSCDACRINKTKCSGGPSCSLCTRRGIECVFRSGARSLQPSSSRVDVVESEQIPRSEEERQGSNSQATYTATTGSLTEAFYATDEDHLLANLDFFRQLQIVPTQRTSTRHVDPLGAGMEAIHQALIAKHSSLSQVMRDSPEMTIWTKEASNAFLTEFHLRWPVLHAPTFDIEEDPLPLTATVCMIGTWVRSSTKPVDPSYVLKVHDLLLHQFLQDIVNSASSTCDEEWPIDFFRAVLLNLVFSLCRTEKQTMSKAMLLGNLFTSYLRQLGLFSTTALDAHQEKYCCGTYPLYVLQTRERYKKLAALVFQADAYLALAYGQPPMVHRREVDVELPVTFGLWNAFGINVCIQRLYEDPVGRSVCTISQMTKSPDAFKASPLLIEDIQLGLCGLLQKIWVLAESSPSENKFLGTENHETLVINELDRWKAELERIKNLIDPTTINTGAARYLLLAYRGENESPVTPLERITTLLRDLMLFYYFLRLYTFSSLRAPSHDMSNEQLEVTLLQTAKASKREREPLVCAIEMLKMAEELDSLTLYFNPLVRHALVAGAKLTKELTLARECQCHMKGKQTDAALSVQGGVEQDGSVMVDDISVCACSLGQWSARFEKVLEKQKQQSRF